MCICRWWIILISIGQSLMFNANASSGGLDILAKVLNKYLHIELGKGIAIIGILTVASTILVYDTKTLVVLLANTNNADAGFVTGRIKDAGYSYEMIDGDVDGGAYGD